MTITADPRPTSPLPGGTLSNPDLTKLYMSASCPELKAESVISSSDEEEDNNESRFDKPLMETHDEYDDAHPQAAASADRASEVEEMPSIDDHTLTAEELAVAPIAIGPTPVVCRLCMKPCQDNTNNIIQPSVSSISSSSSDDLSTRRKLQWKFKGLTLWLELEEFDDDLTSAVEDFSSKHSSPFIPKPHTTVIYGMEHLSREEAKARLQQVKQKIGGEWPSFSKPTGVTSDIAECGKPGQVCSIAWSELTLSTNPAHEEALDALHRLFFGEDWSMDSRDRPWKPHNSIAYDNPETNTLSLLDTVMYASRNPTLLGRERRVEAMSLWSTEGKMEEWVCIDRVKFW
jgi:hypothetical protein